MASEGSSPDAPAQVEVKDPMKIENFESGTVSHTDCRSEEQTPKVEGKPKADEVGTSDIPIPKVEEIKEDKKIEDENGIADTHVQKLGEAIPEKAIEGEARVAQAPDSNVEEPLADKIENETGNAGAHVHNIEETTAQKNIENEAGYADLPVPIAEGSIVCKNIEDKVECGDATEPKAEGTIVDKKAADESVQPLATVAKPGNDSQNEPEVTKVNSAKETGSENAAAEEKNESTEAIVEKPTEPLEGIQPGSESIVVLVQEKGVEAFAEDKAKENAVGTESSFDVKPDINESKVQDADAERVPTAENTIFESQEPIIFESPGTGEVPTEKDNDPKLEVAEMEVPADNEVPEPELVPVICASKVDQHVGNELGTPAVEDFSTVAAETEKEHSALKEQVLVEKAADASEVLEVPAPGTDAPLPEIEPEKNVPHAPLASELKFEQEKKVEEGSTNNPEEVTTKEVPGDLPEKVSDLPVEDEIVGSTATSDIIADEPKEQVVQVKVDETVVSADREAQLPEPSVEAARKVEPEVEKEGETIIENKPQNLVAEPIVKTTLHDLMKVDNGNEVIEELVKEPTAEDSAVTDSACHSTNLSAAAEIANEIKRPEPDTGDSEELVKETTRDYVPPSLGPATDGNESSTKGTSQETFADDPEKEVVTEAVKVEERTEVAEKKETAEVVEKVDKEVVDREEETIDANLPSAVETTKNLEEETGKQEVTIKSVPRQSNNIMLKVKQSIVKVKKAITFKSPSSKSSSKANEKAKQ